MLSAYISNLDRLDNFMQSCQPGESFDSSASSEDEPNPECSGKHQLMGPSLLSITYTVAIAD